MCLLDTFELLAPKLEAAIFDRIAKKSSEAEKCHPAFASLCLADARVAQRKLGHDGTQGNTLAS